MSNTVNAAASAIVERIRALDLMRGYFLIVILLDHLAYFPSGLDVLTGRGILYASSAEGFFLISGIVLGMVRGRKLVNEPIIVPIKKLLTRSGQLYLTSVILTLLFTIIGWLFFMQNPNLKYGIEDPSTPLWQVVWNAITLQYTYGWADFLRYYALFMAGTPIVLWLVRKRKWYIAAFASLAIWWSFRFTPEEQQELFAPLAWQLVFVSGFIIGYYWPVIQNFWRKLPTWLRTTCGVALFSAFITTAALSAWIVFGSYLGAQPQGDISGEIWKYFDKTSLPIPRLLLGTIWFWGLFWIVRRFEAKLTRALGRLLLPLGTNSLYVYTIEAFFVFFLHLFIVGPQPYIELAPWYINLFWSLAALAAIWALTRKKFLFGIIPR